MKVGLGLYLFFLASQLAVAFEAIDSWRSKIFLPSQMLARYRRPGINFLTHGGMWLDMFLLPALLTYMLAHSGDWSVGRDWLIILIGIGMTAANHVLLMNNERPDPLGCADLKWSPAIAVHAVYMAAYIAIIGHFYFNTVGASSLAVAMVSILLGIHVAAGTHVFLGLAHLVYRWEWCPDPLADKALPIMNGAIWLLLTAFAWHAGGFRAGYLVALSGLAFGIGVVIIAMRARSTSR